MTLLAGPAGIVGKAQVGLGQEVFEQTPSILEQSFAQSQFDGFEIADPFFGYLLTDQPQEGLGFLESSVLDFFGLEFFLLGAVGISS
jgi:hypothetical protein